MGDTAVCMWVGNTDNAAQAVYTLQHLPTPSSRDSTAEGSEVKHA